MSVRLFPLAGIAFIGLLVASLFVGGGTPDSGATVSEVASFYDDDLTRQYLSAFLLAAAAPFAVLFGVSLADALSNGIRSGWGDVVRAGSILAAGAVLLGAALHIAVVDGGDQGISDAGLQTLNTLDGNTWIGMTSAVGVLFLGAAGGMLSACSHRVLSWSALVLGIALFLPVLGLVAIIPSAVWIVAASVVFARGSETDEAAVDGRAVPTGA